jgi:predicted amidohydrolase YtcJ
MTTAADLILTDARVQTLERDREGPEPDAEAVAVRDGQVVRVDSAYEVEFLEAAGTTVVDLDGRTLLPGFIDAHTHLEMVGRRAREADLGDATGPAACLDRLRARRDETDGWVLGLAYDESRWADSRYLRREDLDEVSTDRPVAAFREDMHLASVNSVALDRHGADLPERDVRRESGEPTGVLVEDALDTVWEAIGADPGRTREYLRAAQETANRRGVTAVHDMVRHSHAPRVYRELDRADELTLRVRINYWSDHLDAVLETGLRTGHGSDRVRTGAIKSYTDGSIGGRTARLSEPYADTDAGDETETGSGDADENRGEWVVPPADLADLVERVDDAGLQMTTHAIGDAAIAATLDAYEGTDGERHRIEHVEVLTDDLVERLASSDAVVSAQPNFLKWAREGGLYADRLGDERRRHSNRFRTLADRGVELAFGSDCMPLDPLFGIAQAVDAPAPEQRLSVFEALRAYTHGAARAGFDEDRMGTITSGNCADLVVLDESPWTAEHIADIDVAMTVVGGEIVHDGRE